jgi:AcrR family transcriptional regulator
MKKPSRHSGRKTDKYTKNIDVLNVLDKKYLLPCHHDGESDSKERILMAATVLFCRKSYEGVTMRDIAAEIGITAGALYNHFESKAVLLDAVLDHAIKVHRLYLDHLDVALKEADSFEAALDLMLIEPSNMRNPYTGYAFSLFQTEQFRSERAGDLFIGMFVEHNIKFHKDWFDELIRRGLARPFDTNLITVLFNSLAMMAVTLHAQRMLHERAPYDAKEIFNNFRKLILEQAAL